MRRFEGRSGVAFGCGLTGVLLLSLVGFVISQSASQWHTFDPGEATAGIWLMAGFCASGVFLFWLAREAAASFELDEDQIVRRAWGRTTALAWREIEDFVECSAITLKAEPNSSGRLVLYGPGRERLAIRYQLLVDAPGLRAALEPHLAPLRDAGLRTIAKHGRLFRPYRANGFVMLTTMLPIFLVGGLSGLEIAGKGRSDDGPATWYLAVAAIAASPLIVVLALELISRKLTVMPDGLALRSLFLDRSIPFSQVESINVKVLSGEGASVERARIRSVDGQSITLESSMPAYRPALDLARRHVAVKSKFGPSSDADFA